MYLPRSIISKLYIHLQKTRHQLSPPVLILVALDPDALCACRILTRLLKHDYIQHKIQPVAGYSDLERVGRDLVAPMMESRGGSGGVVVCLGVGGMVDLGPILGLEPESEDPRSAYGGVEVWVIDSHRPWNLSNIFGGAPVDPETSSQAAVPKFPPGVKDARIGASYRPTHGGIIVFDDGDIDDSLIEERDAYLTLVDMPEIDETNLDDDLSDSEDEDDDGDVGDGNPTLALPAPPSAQIGQKRKSWSDDEDDEDDIYDSDDRPHQRRRSNSSTPLPDSPRPQRRGLLSLQQPRASNTLNRSSTNDSKISTSKSNTLSPPPLKPYSSTILRQKKSPKAMRRELVQLRRQKEDVLRKYYAMGSSYSEPISSILYSLASELGREDNDLLWFTIIGVTSTELYGRSSAGVAVTARSSSAARNSAGWMGLRGSRIRQLLRDEVRRLNPPIDSGRSSPESLGVIPTTARSPEDHSIRLSPEPKFLLIRHWSLYDSMLHSPYLFSRLRIWSGSGIKRLHKLLAKMGVSLVQCKQSYTHMDMMLKRDLRTKLLKYAQLYNLEEMVPSVDSDGKDRGGAKDGWGFVRSWGWRATLSAQDVGVIISALLEVGRNHSSSSASNRNGNDSYHTDDEAHDASIIAAREDEWVSRFWDAYDALQDVDALKTGLPIAQSLYRAIYRTGTSLINKRQIRHLQAFRLCVVKEGPDVALFTHPAALTKLALWVGEALLEQDRDTMGRLPNKGRGTPLVVAGLDEQRGVYVVVGTGGGGGPDTAFLHREAAKQRKQKREAKAKKKELAKLAKERQKVERKEAKEAEKKRKREEARKKKTEGGDDGDEEGDDDKIHYSDAANGDEDELESESEEESESDSDSESESDSDVDHDDSQRRGFGLNRFGNAFQDVIAETNSRVRVDSFEHCVVEVKKDDLGTFLESLSMKAVVG